MQVGTVLAVLIFSFVMTYILGIVLHKIMGFRVTK